jgi:hypothetical protein
MSILLLQVLKVMMGGILVVKNKEKNIWMVCSQLTYWLNKKSSRLLQYLLEQLIRLIQFFLPNLWEDDVIQQGYPEEIGQVNPQAGTLMLVVRDTHGNLITAGPRDYREFLTAKWLAKSKPSLGIHMPLPGEKQADFPWQHVFRNNTQSTQYLAGVSISR